MLNRKGSDLLLKFFVFLAVFGKYLTRSYILFKLIRIGTDNRTGVYWFYLNGIALPGVEQLIQRL